MNRVQKHIIKDAMDEQHQLSEWEARFIDDIADYEDDRELSYAQNKVLNRIGSKLNGGD